MKIKTQLFIALIGLILSMTCAQGTTVFAHSFSGGTGDLDGASTDSGSGTWVASPMFDLNGDVNITDAGSGSATVAFTPDNGMVYTLQGSASLSIGGSGDWLAFGFANGQSAESVTGNRFLGNLTSGKTWMLTRENTNNPLAALNLLEDAPVWEGLTNSPTHVDYQIVLDTTGGSGSWTATWFAKDSASSDFTEVRSITTLVEEDINSVGFAISGTGTTAQINSISLTAVPEPSHYAVLIGGLAILFALRRRWV